MTLPSFEEVKADKFKFAQATKIIHQETNPLNARTLVQYHDPLCNFHLLATMRDYDDRHLTIPLLQERFESVTDQTGGFDIKRRCSLVEYQDRRPPYESASDGNTLSLSA